MRSDSYERDGIEYTVSVYESGGRYRAIWTCWKCERRGGSKETYLSEAEAIGRCEAALFVDHHIPAHFLPQHEFNVVILRDSERD